MTERLKPPHSGNGNIRGLTATLHETAQADAQLLIVGSLDAISPEAEWRGAVSIADRLDSGELSETEIPHGFELANGLYVPARLGAAMRCSDERGDKGYDENADDEDLGPQLLGATPALASALWLYNTATDANYTKKIKDELPAAIEIVHELGYGPGAHGDLILMLAGCGDAKTKGDQMSVIAEGSRGFYGLVKAYGEDDFSSRHFRNISTSVHDSITARGLVIPPAPEMAKAVISANPNGYFEKVGPHQGVGVLKNKVEETTLNINRLDAMTHSRLNVFNIDAWLDGRIAGIISSDPDRQSLVKNIRYMQSIATSMILLDGTPHYGVRSPKD